MPKVSTGGAGEGNEKSRALSRLLAFSRAASRYLNGRYKKRVIICSNGYELNII
jgi:hypothetical protein